MKANAALWPEWFGADRQRQAIVYTGALLEKLHKDFGVSPGCSAAAGFQPYDERMARALARAGVNLALIYFSKGHGKAYESGSVRQVRAFIRRCHHYGIRVALHYSFGHFFPDYFLRDYPQAEKWAARDARGEAIRTLSGMRVVCCPNQKGWIDALIGRCRDGLTIGADGIFFDNSAQRIMGGMCHCDACRKLFRAETGRAIPAGKDWTHPALQQFYQFRARSVARAMRRIVGALRRTKPDLVVMQNCRPGIVLDILDSRPDLAAGKAATPFAPPRLFVNDPFVCAAGNAIPFFESGTSMPGIQNGRIVQNIDIYRQGLSSGAPIVNLIYPPKYKFSASLPVSLLQRTLAEGWLARAATCLPWRIEGANLFGAPRAIRAVREYYRFHANHPEIMQGVPQARIGVYFSAATRDWIGEAFEIRGFALMLLELHKQFDFITDADLGRLDQFELVILPNVVCLSARETGSFKKFLRAGGKLLISGQTGRRDGHGRVVRPPRGLGKKTAGLAVIKGKIGTRYWESRAPRLRESLRPLLPANPHGMEYSGPASIFTALSGQGDELRVNLINYGQARGAAGTRLRLDCGVKQATLFTPESAPARCEFRQVKGGTEIEIRPFMIFASLLIKTVHSAQNTLASRLKKL